jgi:hypothetical protein
MQPPRWRSRAGPGENEEPPPSGQEGERALGATFSRISESILAPLTAPRKSARTVSMGNARAPFSKRGDDIYETPPAAVEALLRVERLPEHIWEPCCGSGRMVATLRAHGYRVTASDLVADRIDFLMEWRAPEGVGAIVTNPPFKPAADFVRHGLRLVPTVAMLLRLNFIEAEGRADIMDGGTLARVHAFVDRLPRMHRAGWTGNRSSSTTAFAWFVWEREHTGPIILDRIRCRGVVS